VRLDNLIKPELLVDYRSDFPIRRPQCIFPAKRSGRVKIRTRSYRNTVLVIYTKIVYT